MSKHPNLSHILSLNWNPKNLFLHSQFDSKYVPKPVTIMKTASPFEKQVIVDNIGIKGTDE